MAKFAVTVVRSYVTVIQVEADSLASAREQVSNYGLVEAVSDYPVIKEDLAVERIKKIERV